MVRIDSRDPDFAKSFAHLLTLKREIAEDVDDAVRKIIADVVAQGDDALVAYTRRFDRSATTSRPSACASVRTRSPPPSPPVRRRRSRHSSSPPSESRPSTGPKKPADHKATDALGVTAGWRWTALESVGLYVPAGRRATRPPC